MDKPSLSRLERRKNRTTTRLCMICGNYTPFGQCMIYPKGKRREFDEALDLPKFVSDALPSSCSICIKHFENADVVSVRADAHAKVKIDAVPCKGMDGIFLEKLRELDPLEVLAKPDVNPISVVKEKLGLDRHTRYVKPLGRSEEVSEDEDDKVEDDPRSILAYLFTNFSKRILRQLKA
ncbi:unnamed protein product [Bursaphelenchus okinawaensis]|uniref:Uncharacterized protein n=1 Tax=Bursaphelenchus okinawaensis TaxID=465554 RepID=A0A811JRU5_9BILA|nr:unnamed protein product [Bursaphelenchus okinawaensis]CAG9080705.1 unnamed protein product [Bursaphelenchus okinawaensis]